MPSMRPGHPGGIRLTADRGSEPRCATAPDLGYRFPFRRDAGTLWGRGFNAATAG
jgi:hypothetical protein